MKNKKAKLDALLEFQNKSNNTFPSKKEASGLERNEALEDEAAKKLQHEAFSAFQYITTLQWNAPIEIKE